MKIAFSTLGCPRWSWQEIIATAHDLGFDGVEVRGVGKDISVPSVPAFSAEQLPGTRARLAQLALSIPCLDSDCCIHLPETAARTQAEVRAYIDLAERLQTPYVRVMACAAVPQPTGRVDDIFVRDAAQALAEYAAGKGVTLLIETNGVYADSTRLARLLSAVASAHVAALWDVHHPYRYFGERPADTFDNLRPWLRHLHVKDSLMDGGSVRYALPGFGDVPLLDIVDTLSAGGYEGYYSLEWVKRWDMTLEEPGIVFAHYASFMRSLG